MDAPRAKWTLDLCVDQGAPWPIYLSEVQPWPDSVAEAYRKEGWENNIKQTRSLKFTPYTMQPGQAVIFSGSSQWHYRDPMPKASGKQFCTLLFFHYIPKGAAELVRAKNWARLFGIPELSGLSENEHEKKESRFLALKPAHGESALLGMGARLCCGRSDRGDRSAHSVDGLPRRHSILARPDRPRRAPRISRLPCVRQYAAQDRRLRGATATKASSNAPGNWDWPGRAVRRNERRARRAGPSPVASQPAKTGEPAPAAKISR